MGRLPNLNGINKQEEAEEEMGRKWRGTSRGSMLGPNYVSVNNSGLEFRIKE